MLPFLDFVVGMVVVRLAKFECIDAAVLLHPGPITEDQIIGECFDSCNLKISEH